MQKVRKEEQKKKGREINVQLLGANERKQEKKKKVSYGRRKENRKTKGKEIKHWRE